MLLGAPTQDPAPRTADPHTAAPVPAAITAGAGGAPEKTGTSAGEPRVEVSSLAVAVAPSDPASRPSVRRRPGVDSYALVAALVVCGVLGLTLGPLAPLLEQATTIVTGRRHDHRDHR